MFDLTLSLLSLSTLAVRVIAQSSTSSIIFPSLPTTVIQPASIANLPNKTHQTISLDFSTANADLGTDDVAGSAQTPLKCLNCSTSGSLTISAGGFDLENDNLVGGYLHICAQDVRGHAEMEIQAASLEHDFTPFSKVNPFPVIGFPVPLGIVGLFVEFQILVSLQTTEPADIFFGFDFALAQDAYIHLKVADLSSSTSYGFTPDEGLTIDALPFHANTSDTGALAFRRLEDESSSWL